MKTNKLIRTILTVVCMVCSLAASARPKAIADIIMKDGTRFSNVELVLPRGWEKNIKFKDASNQLMVLSRAPLAIGSGVFWQMILC